VPPLKRINDGKVMALTAVQKIEAGSVMNHHGQRQGRQLHQRGRKPHGKAAKRQCLDLPTELLIQGSLWQRSAHELQLCGPAYIWEALRQQTPWTAPTSLKYGNAQSLRHPGQPLRCDDHVSRDGHTSNEGHASDLQKGCERMPLAFDLGEANIKTIAVTNDKVLDSKETEVDAGNPDPDCHFNATLKAGKDTVRE